MERIKSKLSRNSRIEDFIEVTGLLWEKGWAESNAGNMSVNLTGEIDTKKQHLEFGPSRALETTYPHLAGQIILMTATGARMREVPKNFDNNTCVIVLNNKGNGYNILKISDQVKQNQPTSELPTHLAIHEMLVAAGRKEKAVVHTHPTNLLSLSHIRDYCNEETINNMLWSMQPETYVFLNDGVGFVPYLMTGSEELAGATIKKLENHHVVMWEKHGCLAIGETCNDAFDLLDVLDKSASIFFTCKSAGFDAEGISKKCLDELSKKFNL
jgi:rhamnulose-1-phosphate aldolase